VNKVLVIVRKELLEIREQRMLLLGIIAPPLIITLVILVTTSATAAATTDVTSTNGGTSYLAGFPMLRDLSPREAAQALIVIQMSILYLLLPLIVSSIVAAYSIVGEKTGHTLEPLLATPIRTGQLLVGKCLTAFTLGVGTTWLSGIVFVVGLAFMALTPRVFAAAISPGWLIMFLIWTPLLALAGIGLITIVSSRVNDPRTAQQVSAVLIIPFLAVFLGPLAGIQVLSLTFTIVVAVILGLLALLSIWGATKLFQRERILTSWK
jgi:ABC-2 type transport system permease protein